MMIIMLLTLLAGFLIGWSSNSLYSKFSIHNNNKKILHDTTKQFSEVLENIKSNKALFKSRVNQTVYITTNIKDYGDVELVYLMDKKDIALFKENKCIYTSHILGNMISDIITSIRIKFNNEINDTVEVLGIVFSKSDFKRMFKMDPNDIEKHQQAINKIQEDQKSDIQKIIEKNEKKLSLNDILDKIGEVGYNNLTPDEKEFLKNNSN